MKHAAAAVALSLVLTAPTQLPLPNPLPDQASGVNAERVENGEGLSADGAHVPYRIRLLPIASFPDLPPPVAEQLRLHHCMIPQSFEAQTPENVIHGAFRAPGSRDWAALCSSQEATTLYVFFAGQFDAPLALHTQPDSAWLGAEPGASIYGSAWGIAVRSAAELRASPELRRGMNIDHDAIDDARLERSLAVRYFENGRWINLNHRDGSD
ncbi:MAG TPA: hypothetical protein VL990_09080 [Acidobacteriaceae bacterium]|nr:hypothetical protein [Acidobacteriaceae bacterium]